MPSSSNHSTRRAIYFLLISTAYLQSPTQSAEKEAATTDLPPAVLQAVEREFGGRQNVTQIARKEGGKSYDAGSIGRRLTADEWRASQAWQAIAGYNMAKNARLADIDGIVWCPLRGGGNGVTYMKPLIDYEGHAKLVFYALRAVFQPVFPASHNVDIVYGPADAIVPVIMNLGDARTVDLIVRIRDVRQTVVQEKAYPAVKLSAGRTIATLPEFKPAFPAPGPYGIEYHVYEGGRPIDRHRGQRRVPARLETSGLAILRPMDCPRAGRRRAGGLRADGRGPAGRDGRIQRERPPDLQRRG
jgi:hypothetical protein